MNFLLLYKLNRCRFAWLLVDILLVSRYYFTPLPVLTFPHGTERLPAAKCCFGFLFTVPISHKLILTLERFPVHVASPACLSFLPSHSSRLSISLIDCLNFAGISSCYLVLPLVLNPEKQNFMVWASHLFDFFSWHSFVLFLKFPQTLGPVPSSEVCFIIWWLGHRIYGSNALALVRGFRSFLPPFFRLWLWGIHCMPLSSWLSAFTKHSQTCSVAHQI